MKLTEKIHLLKIDFEITVSPEKKLSRFVNVLIIFGEQITLIDTGVKGSSKFIFDHIKKNNREISGIKTILLSHSHPDHIGSAAEIKELTNCKVYAHKNEINWIEDIHVQNIERPVPGFFSLVDQSVCVDEILSDGQTFKADNDITLQIIHSPGHSRGSLNFYFPEHRILFTADSIPLKNDIPNYDNYHELMNSLKRIRYNRDYDILLTSWTPPLTKNMEIDDLIREGEEYMLKIDNVVKGCYPGNKAEPLSSCKSVIDKLGLPPFLANPIVDKAFRSHL